eukprot:6172305-Amphidinium_carterae.1
MLAVSHFDISENSFTGMLHESGLREVTVFYIYTNRFTGALPDGGMRAMPSVTFFAIFMNSFTAMLPKEWVQEGHNVQHCKEPLRGSAPRRRPASNAGRDSLRYWKEQLHGNASREWP